MKKVIGVKSHQPPNLKHVKVRLYLINTEIDIHADWV